MKIRDTIQTLAKMRQSIDAWTPQCALRPDALIADLNDLYVASAQNSGMDELFAYDDVGNPSLTLIVGIEVEFDIQTVMESLRTRLHIPLPGRADEIANAGIVWSHGRYDFVYDHDSRSLRISHQYSHRGAHTKSVSSIAKRMIEYAMSYLQEVHASVAAGGCSPQTE